MWNLSDISKKKKYTEEELKKCSDDKQREKLQLSLLCYLGLLDNSGSMRYTKFYNIMDKITQNKYSEEKDKEYAQMEYDLFFKDKSYLDNDYLQFLLDICDNISKTEYVNFDGSISTFNVSYEDILKTSYNFYQDIGDQELFNNARKILTDESSINISNFSRLGMADCSGLTYNDFLYGKSYINLTRKNNIFDFQVLNHEIMHGIDFYFKNKYPSKNYYGFHEIPTYTIDYLFIDYLDSKGFDPNEIQKLKMQKDNYLQELARLTQTQIKGELIQKKIYKNPTVDDIRQILNPKIIKQLLELETGVISFGLYKQIRNDKDYGLNNLKTIMKNIIPKNSRPNFTNIDLYDSILIDLSKEIGSYSNNMNRGKSI